MSELTHEAYIPDVETEEDRVATFEQQLSSVTDVRTLNLELDLYQEDPVRIGVNQVFAETYGASGPTLAVHPNFEFLTTGGDVGFQAFSTRTGKRSAHGVFFGQLTNKEGRTVEVAVKPHAVEARHSSATDYVTNAAVEKLGMHNLQPVGVMMPHNEETAYSLSQLDRTITTLDSINWKALRKQDRGDYEQIWSQVARQTALIHSLGSVAHGDLAARNIALKVDGGIFPMDWERAKMSLNPTRDVEARYALSQEDLRELMESMVRSPQGSFKAGLGLFEHEDSWTGFEKLIFTEYAQTRVGYARNPAEARDVIEEVAELQSSLRSHLRIID